MSDDVRPEPVTFETADLFDGMLGASQNEQGKSEYGLVALVLAPQKVNSSDGEDNPQPPVEALLQSIQMLAKKHKLLPSSECEKQVAVHKESSDRGNLLICMEDGADVFDLESHLRKKHKMDWYEYLNKWGLPANHPTTAVYYGRTEY